MPTITTNLPLLAIDPGKNALGWAYFGAGGFLVTAGVARSTKQDRDVASIARELMKQLRGGLSGMGLVKAVVIEQMRVYPGPQQKGDQNDLMDLSYISGGVHMLSDVAEDAFLYLVPAREWKGQVPKNTMQERIERSLRDLEKSLVVATLQNVPEGIRHNGWDAVGIGLWAQGRLR
jgi:hypothetical protein